LKKFQYLRIGQIVSNWKKN